MKKTIRNDISMALKQIAPPDFIIRKPRDLKNKKFWKAAEVRDCLLFYFPIILKNKLPKKYYQHFLLLVSEMRILLQERIHTDEIYIAESLLRLFVHDVVKLYGLEKCSFNVHQLMHMAEWGARNWGPLWAWSASTFEDGIGYFKKMNHGPNKVDMEIVNAIKMFNANYNLKDKLNISHNYECNVELKLDAAKNHILNEHEIEAIQLMNLGQEDFIINENIAHIY